MSSRLRWKKKKRVSLFDAELHTLSRDGEWIVCAQQTKDEKWFWYGAGVNTSNQPVSTLEEAKAQAMHHVKKHKL